MTTENEFDMDFDFDGSETNLRPERGEVSRPEPTPTKIVMEGDQIVERIYERTTSHSSAVTVQSQQESSASSASGSVLYCDIETIPDYDREHLFGLPPLPTAQPVLPMDELLDPASFLSQTADELKVWFANNNPCEEWVDACNEAEKKGKGRSGNRKGVFDLLKKAKESKDAVGDQIKANRKKMSTTPEMCQIVAIGFAVDDAQVLSLVAGEDGVTERDMLETFWSMATKASHFCGFNIAGFDIPTIFVRSILLGVPASRMIDLSPYKNQVIDLMVSRFGRGIPTGFGLKNLCKLLDIQAPCPDVNGSDVDELFRTNPELLRQYVTSDVIVTRKLHRLYSGFFCI